MERKTVGLKQEGFEGSRQNWIKRNLSAMKKDVGGFKPTLNEAG